VGEHPLEVIFQDHRQKIADMYGKSGSRLPSEYQKEYSTTDLIFVIGYILDKCEKDTDVHMVLTDFK
jgi:hypothetical protein